MTMKCTTVQSIVEMGNGMREGGEGEGEGEGETCMYCTNVKQCIAEYKGI